MESSTETHGQQYVVVYQGILQGTVQDPGETFQEQLHGCTRMSRECPEIWDIPDTWTVAGMTVQLPGCGHAKHMDTILAVWEDVLNGTVRES